jgi:hypothetical protein
MVAAPRAYARGAVFVSSIKFVYYLIAFATAFAIPFSNGPGMIFSAVGRFTRLAKLCAALIFISSVIFETVLSSAPNSMTSEQVKVMDKNPIVFALANPIPEIMPEEAKRGGAAVIATGRSDYPNQINNSLVFPGVFRGALDNTVSKITDEMKIKAAHNLASLVKRPTAEKIIPGPFEKGIAKAVAKAIK